MVFWNCESFIPVFKKRVGDFSMYFKGYEANNGVMTTMTRVENESKQVVNQRKRALNEPNRACNECDSRRVESKPEADSCEQYLSVKVLLSIIFLFIATIVGF
jgi:hypothetical protein